MPTSKLVLSIGMAVLLGGLLSATAKKWNSPREQAAHDELAKLQSLRYSEWVPPEQ